LSSKTPPADRRALQETRDALAVVKMAKLLAQNKKMTLHGAAAEASRYTTGASPPATTRRLVKRFKTAVHKYFKTRAEKDDSHLDPVLSYSDTVIFAEATKILCEFGSGTFGYCDDNLAIERARATRVAHQLIKIYQRLGDKIDRKTAQQISQQQWSLKKISNLDFELDMVRINRPNFFDAFPGECGSFILQEVPY
jgi:hypothetical protein